MRLFPIPREQKEFARDIACLPLDVARRGRSALKAPDDGDSDDNRTVATVSLSGCRRWMDRMTDHINQLQKARERLVATRREMAEVIATTASLSPDRAAEFTAIQEAINSMDEAIRDETIHDGASRNSGGFLST
jgi:hypothetical protein